MGYSLTSIVAAVNLTSESITMALFLVGAFEKKLATAIDPLIATTSLLQNEVRNMKEAIRTCFLIDIGPPSPTNTPLPAKEKENVFKIPRLPPDAQQQQIQRVSSTDLASASSSQVYQNRPGERRKRKYTKKAGYWVERWPDSKKKRIQASYSKESPDHHQRFNAQRKCLLCFKQLKSGWVNAWVNDISSDCTLASHEKEAITNLYRERARGLQTPVRSPNVLQITPIGWSNQREITISHADNTVPKTTADASTPTCFYDSAGHPGSFSIAIAEAVPPPAHRNCINAINASDPIIIEAELTPTSLGPDNLQANFNKPTFDPSAGNADAFTGESIATDAIEVTLQSKSLTQFIADLPVSRLTDSDSPDESEETFVQTRSVKNYWTVTDEHLSENTHHEDIPSRPATPDFHQPQAEGLHAANAARSEPALVEATDNQTENGKVRRSSVSSSSPGSSDSDTETGPTGSSSSSAESPTSSPGKPVISIPYLSPEYDQTSPKHSPTHKIDSEAVPSDISNEKIQHSPKPGNLYQDPAYPSDIPVGYSTPSTAAAVESILQSLSAPLADD